MYILHLTSTTKVNRASRFLRRCGYRKLDELLNHARNAFALYRDWKSTVEEFFTPEGRRHSLLGLNGTIPILHNGQNSDMAVEIWLLPSYPESAPIVFVIPGPQDCINVSRHVDETGMVFNSYLREWGRSNNCDLVQLMAVLTSDFSEAPPFLVPEESTDNPEGETTVASNESAGPKVRQGKSTSSN